MELLISIIVFIVGAALAIVWDAFKLSNITVYTGLVMLVCPMYYWGHIIIRYLVRMAG